MPLAQAKVFYYDFVEIKPWTYELVISNLGLAFVGSKNSNIESSILGFYPNHIWSKIPKNWLLMFNN